MLSRILKHDCDVVIACMDAALQYTIPPSELEARMIELKKGKTVSLEHVVQALVRCGYVRAEQIDGTGQFAVREVFWISSLRMRHIPFELNSGAMKLIPWDYSTWKVNVELKQSILLCWRLLLKCW